MCVVFGLCNVCLDGCHNEKSKASIKKKVCQYLDRAEKIKEYLESTNNGKEVSSKRCSRIYII